MKEALLYNLTARPGTSEPDSDMDGLSDAREKEIGSLAIGHTRIKRLEIEELAVGKVGVLRKRR